MLFFPASTFAIGKKIDQKGVQITETSNEIYVGEGTTIVGLLNMNDTKVINMDFKQKKKSKKISKSTFSQEMTIALSEKKAKIKTAEKVEEQVVNKNVNFFYKGNQKSDSNYSQKSRNLYTAVFSPFNVLQKTVAACADTYQIAAIKLAVKKQKFFTSLSYLQFGKYRSSSLRAPPPYLD